MYRFDIRKDKNTPEDTDYLVFHMPDGININFHEPQGDCAYHSHNHIEFFYILKGSIEHTLNGKKSVISQGDFALIDVNSSHEFKKIGNENCNLINILFYPSFVDRSLSETDSFKDILLSNREFEYSKNPPSDEDINHVYHEEGNVIRNHVLNMQHEFFSGKSGFLKILKLQVKLLIAYIQRYIHENSFMNEEKTPIDLAIEYINRNYNQKISLKEISDMLHYTPQHFCTKFKSETGFTVVEYIQKVRVETSCRLLQNTNMKITDIANAVGYSDIQYFEMVFRKYTDRTPSRMRQIWKSYDGTE